MCWKISVHSNSMKQNPQSGCANLFDVDEVHLCLCLAKPQVDVQYNPKHYKENEN